ncbi:MAG: hypothetical protein ACOZNI_36870 [Myxococcota bacterium]
MIVAWALLACTAEPEAPPPAAPAPPPPPVAPVTVWTAQNVQELVPAAPKEARKVARPIPPLPAYDTTLQELGHVVERYAGDPDNPWAVAHGILARGASFRLTDGREAIPHLFATYAEPRAAGALTLVGFPRSRGEIRVEPHTDLLLKNMGEAGVAPDATFPSAQGTSSVADLYRWTLLKTYLEPRSNHSSYDSPNDVPWGLQALAQWAPPGELQWVAVDGTPMDLDDLTDFAVTVLAKESGFLAEAMAKGQKFEKAGQGVFKYTCGGAHLLQGASYAVARGYGSPKGRQLMAAQAAIQLYRLPIELAIYDEATKRNPKHKTRLLVQRMKFLGHFLESTAKLEALGFYSPDDAQLRLIEGAAQNLALTVEALKRQGTFDHMEELRKEDEQLYLDVVGDAAHAVRGLELALGRGSIGL